jgi:hypothetical protein
MVLLTTDDEENDARLKHLRKSMMPLFSYLDTNFRGKIPRGKIPLALIKLGIVPRDRDIAKRDFGSKDLVDYYEYEKIIVQYVGIRAPI